MRGGCQDLCLAAPQSKPQSLAGNLLLSLAVTLGLVAGLELICRRLEPQRPARVVAEREWAPEDGAHFYTLKRAGAAWPPWQEVNPDGVRDRAHAREKPAATERVVFLGDSVTAGFGVRAQEAYPRMLQEQLDAAGRRLEIMDVAVWGWSTRQERIAYHRIARGYRPDLVVLGVCLNDIPELEWQTRPPPRALALLHLHSALVRRVVDASYREMRSVEELFTASPPLDTFFREVRALRDEVRADGARFALVVFPFRFQLTAGAPEPTVQRAIGAFCAREGIPALDLLAPFRSAGPEVFFDENHLTPVGARLTASTLLSWDVLPHALDYRRALVRWLEAQGERGRAGVAWLQTGSDPGQAAGVLLRALDSPSALVRAQALWALERTGYTASQAARICQALRDSDEPVRAAAARALGAGGKAAGAAIPALLAALDDARAMVRWQAADALWRLDVQSAGRVAELNAALDNQDPYVRQFAAYTLGKLGQGATGAVPALVRLAGDEGGSERTSAGRALRELGPAARGALPGLRSGLRSPDAAARLRATRVLEQLGPVAAELVPELTAALQDPDGRVRAQAALTLGSVGPAARPAVVALLGLLHDPDSWARTEAARAVGKLDAGSPECVRALSAALEDREADVRIQAARALGRFGARALTAEAPLRRALGDPSPRVRTEVETALGNITRR